MKNKEKVYDIIPATFDPVFKEIFTSPDCHNFVCALISEITKLDINYLKKHLKVINTSLPKSRAYEKTSIADVLLSVDGNILNIEMNNEYYNGLFQKNDMYQHTILSRTMQKGQSYKKLKKVIQINIDNFNKFKKEISLFKLMEVETHEIENEDYIKYHIALPRIMKKYYNGNKLNYLEKLLCIIGAKNKEELNRISVGDEILMEASKKIEDLSLEELFSDLYDVEKDRQMAERAKEEYKEEMAQKKAMKLAKKEINNFKKQMNNLEKEAKEAGIKAGIKEGIKEGKKEGIKEGKKEGLEIGEKNKAIEIAKKMLDSGMDKQEIIKYTGITEEELKDL